MLIRKTESSIQKAVSRKIIAPIMLFAYLLFPIVVKAQCAMCRASLESEGNKTKVEAVNDGIVLLMAVPYIVAALIGFAIYRMYFKKSPKQATISKD